MSQDHFDPVLFIKEHEATHIDLGITPFFCNNNGFPEYLQKLPSHVTELEEAERDGSNQLGHCYTAYARPPEQPDPEFGEQSQLVIDASVVEYAPLPATRVNAAAFGLTLIEPNQGIRLRSDTRVLQQIDFEYGMFAGHRSPYQGTKNRLLGMVCTDLEYHDFPHVFASIDPYLPLVISVARFWPSMHRIYLADLWLPRGSALYSPPPCPSLSEPFLNLHGNRNSALACWPGLKRSSITTQTLLRANGGYFHWFWNELPSIHPPFN